MRPGATTLTVMPRMRPRVPSTCRTRSARPSTPRSSPGRHCPSGPTTELMAIMRPARCFNIGRNADWQIVKAAVRLVAEHGVPILAFHPQQQLVARDAGVVDQDIDPAMALEHAADRCVAPTVVGDLERQRLGLAPSCARSRRPRAARCRRAPRPRPSPPGEPAPRRWRGRCRATRL